MPTSEIFEVGIGQLDAAASRPAATRLSPRGPGVVAD
jgi:hypothetical protein